MARGLAWLRCVAAPSPETGRWLVERGYSLESVDEGLVVEAVKLVDAASRRQASVARLCEDAERGAVLIRLSAYVAAATREQVLLRRVADRLSKTVTPIAEELARTVAAMGARAALAGEAQAFFRLASWLGVRARFSGEVADVGPLVAKWPIAVRFWDFARLAPPEWRPINWPVVRGWVLVDPGDAARLVEEAWEQSYLRLAEAADDLVVGYVRDVLRGHGLLDLLAELARSSRSSIELRRVEQDGEGGLPPCVASLLEALRRGENLPHSARFALAAFMCSYLLAMGKPVEEAVAEIAEMFKTAPDYDEKITRYQVEHICGLRGGMKRYTPPSCEWMRTNDLCVANCGVTHPMQYVYKKRKVVKKRGVEEASVPD